MSKAYSVEEIVCMHYDIEYSAFEDAPLHVFSEKHEKRMQKVFKLFEKNKRKYYSKLSPSKSSKPLSLRKRLLFVAIIIILLAFVTGAVIIFMSDAFKGTVYNDNTKLFSIDIGDSPTTIEKVYTLSVVPEGYEFYDSVETDTAVNTFYKNSDGQLLSFRQFSKMNFVPYINTEGYELQNVSVNGCDAVLVEYDSVNGVETILFWNSEDYILNLDGVFTKKEMLKLANSNEIMGF